MLLLFLLWERWKLNSFGWPRERKQPPEQYPFSLNCFCFVFCCWVLEFIQLVRQSCFFFLIIFSQLRRPFGFKFSQVYAFVEIHRKSEDCGHWQLLLPKVSMPLSSSIKLGFRPPMPTCEDCISVAIILPGIAVRLTGVCLSHLQQNIFIYLNVFICLVDLSMFSMVIPLNLRNCTSNILFTNFKGSGVSFETVGLFLLYNNDNIKFLYSAFHNNRIIALYISSLY